MRALLIALGFVFAATACGSSSHTVQRTVYARGIENMSAFAYDAHGRLWVARSGATTHGSDGVYVVAKAGATPVKAIGRVRGPLGLVWVRGSLYVSTLDGVYRFSGLTPANRFTRRTLILRGPVAGAENNNLVLAPNGRLVMGISATCDHCANYARPSGSVVSFTTAGQDLKVVATRVRAACGLVYDGGVLYATMNQRDDLGAKTPGDLLAIVRNGQDWGFPQCYTQGGAACTGVPSAVATLDAHAGAGGVAVVNGTAIVAEWNLGKVVAVPLGGSKKPFVLATGIAHPLPVIADADGSFLVGDWGSGVIYRFSGLS
ncbi:MAG TPA: hypothetical protein VHV52_03120 [Gaiellaceae bacterium]|nr:hypothetical protein [Gaiellaceae bacterium]